MKKKKILYLIGIIVLILLILIAIYFRKENKETTNKIDATIMSIDNNKITIQDNKNSIYTLDTNKINADIGQDISIIYTGLLDKNKDIQDLDIISYELMVNSTDEIPTTWQDNGIFSDNYDKAYHKLKNMTTEEKIAQLLLVRVPENSIDILKQYQFGGYLFFEKDFENKTKEQVKTMIKEYQNISKIPLLTAVDEEGGEVVRISSNKNLVEEPFKSSQELYKEGGFDLIEKDTIKKSNILSSLGINLNLAPVVDVSTNPDDYMYKRTIGQNTQITSQYAETVISASKSGKVSYTLKHFPGYGNNLDTHTNSSIDNRTLDQIKENDLPPFEAGIEAGAEAVLVSHNIVHAIDKDNPVSLSKSLHNILRNSLNFSGIIITDNIDMAAVNNIDNVETKALLSGNNIIITTDYKTSINNIKKSLENKEISENLIDELAFKVLSWKYYKGLIFDNQK